MRQHDRPAVEQAVGVVDLDRVGPMVAVEAAGEGQPVRAGMRRVAGAELLAVGQPEPALAVDAEARRGVADGALVVRDRLAAGVAEGVRLPRVGGRQFGGGGEELAVLEADDADGAAAVERVALVGDEGAVVLAPLLGAFLVGDPQAALGVVADRRAGLERGRSWPPGTRRLPPDAAGYQRTAERRNRRPSM